MDNTPRQMDSRIPANRRHIRSQRRYATTGASVPRLAPTKWLAYLLLFVAGSPLAARAQEPFSVETQPAPPVEAEPFTLRVEGTWPNGCVPTGGDLTIVGDRIHVRGLGAPCDAVCTQATQDYSFEAGTVEPLDDGLYTVEFRVAQCDGEVLIGTRPLEVVPRLGLPGCAPSTDTLCLDGRFDERRFSVRATYATDRNGGASGAARVVEGLVVGSIDGGLLWFFDERNPEILIKLIDGCAVNDHYWLYLAATTDVGFELSVTDERTGIDWTTGNTDREQAQSVADVEAFPCA